MKVAILGNGFVGNATGYFLKNYCPNITEVAIEDPGQGLIIDDWSDVRFTFICVPTDLNENLRGARAFDKLSINIVGEALKRSSGIPVIRSTVGVDQVSLISQGYGEDFILWPEFLRENHWEEDVNDNSIPMVLGGSDRHVQLFINTVLDKEERKLQNQDKKVIFECSQHEAALMKMSRNAMLAAKVAQSNMLYGLCEEYNSDYDIIKAFLIEDDTLGATHFEVPGPDKRMGFGGKCLPKDTTHYSSLFSHENLYDHVLKYKHK